MKNVITVMVIGGEPGSRVDTCPNCHGSGQEAVIQNTSILDVCNPFALVPVVMGTGKSIEKPCSKCRGIGEMLAKRKISIKIPARQTAVRFTCSQ